jgi:CheY-like chemotaxis protein/two-component sensor histidine kinase
MLSHELRNPLAALLNATNVVRMNGADRPNLQKALNVLDRQGKHMARLLDDLLDVSRIANGKFELRRETMSLTEAMDAALESAATSAEQRQITLERRISSQNPVVVGDSARLQQVMTNLLTNAIRHTKAGGKICIEVTEQDDWLELNVSDDGDGIAENRLPHVFDMFVQFGRQGHQNGGGLGVGLALVRSIVELHGGSVAAHSDGEGRGARFTVRLPRGHARLQQRAAEAPTRPRVRRIVLVEDQADTREMLKLLLEEQGHRVAEAADGRDGIEVIRREKPDVALVDLGLPTLSGFDLAREIRRHDCLRDVFLVALSGYASESDIGSARAAGFDTHLTKPADVDRLNRLLDRLQPD